MPIDFAQIGLGAGITAVVGLLGFLGKRMITGERRREEAGLLLNYAQTASTLKAAGLSDLSETIEAMIRGRLRQKLIQETAASANTVDDRIRPSETQAGMNLRAAGTANVALEKVQAAYRELNQMLSSDASVKLDRSQEAWHVFIHSQAIFASSEVSGGSMEALLHSFEIETLARERLASLQASIEQYNQPK